MDLVYLEDNEVQAEVIIDELKKAKINVHHYVKVNDLIADLPSLQFSIMLLDWVLPDGNADKIIKMVRNSIGWSVPIIVASIRGEEETIVRALSQGADDYIVKPIRIAELLARIESHKRRANLEMPPESIQLGDYELFPQQQTITLKGAPIALSVLEFNLVNFLFQNAGKLVTRPTLLRYVWKISTDVETRTVDATVARLRKKCQFNDGSGLVLQTVHGFGYRLSALEQVLDEN
jgi:two-component system, OmpR family, response regulator RegX3